MANPVKTNIDIRPFIVGEYPVGENVTIAEDTSGVIPQGAVLGVISAGSVANAVAAGGNTGNGTVSASPTKQSGVKVGTYIIRFTSATVFNLIDPDGNVVGQGEAGVAFEKELGFTFTAGGTPMAAGDEFTIVVSAGSGEVARSVSTAVDGSQFPKYVTSAEIDATAGARSNIQVVKVAKVRKDGLVFTGSETIATVVPGTNGKTFGQLLEATGIIPIPGDTVPRFDN